MIYRRYTKNLDVKMLILEIAFLSFDGHSGANKKISLSKA